MACGLRRYDRLSIPTKPPPPLQGMRWQEHRLAWSGIATDKPIFAAAQFPLTRPTAPRIRRDAARAYATGLVADARVPKLPAILRAARRAMALIVLVGFTAAQVGIELPSTM